MKFKIFITTIISLSFSCLVKAQNVGINTTGATPNTSAQLDLNTGNTFTSPNGKGLLIPNVALTGTSDATTVASPATSLFVYNTATVTTVSIAVAPGFYYWDGTKWVAFAGGGSKNWALTGNAGTTASSSAIGAAANNNFIGTLDAQNFVVVTNGKEVGRFLSSGTENLVINSITAATNDIFSSYSSIAGGNAIKGYNTYLGTSGGNGVFGTTTADNGNGVKGVSVTTTTSTAVIPTGVYGQAAAVHGIGVYGQNTNANGTGVVGAGNGLSSLVLAAGSGGSFYGTTLGGYGTVSQTTGVTNGLEGVSPSDGGNGVSGFATSAAVTSSPTGVYGQAVSASGVGVEGIATSVSTATTSLAMGVYGESDSGPGIGVYGISTYSGTVADYPAGVYGEADNLSGTGVVGIATYTGTSTLASPVGVLGISENQYGEGVFGINEATGNTAFPTGVVGNASSSTSGNGVTGLGGTSSGGYQIFPTGTTANGGVFTGGVKGFGIVATNPFIGNGAATNNGYGGGSFTGKGTGSIAGGTYTSSQYAYVSYCLGGTWYKINGTGTVASILRGDWKDQRNVFAPEATEILLQDYGVGTLLNGKVHITIDEVLQKNIAVNEKHPLKVFITLKGNCNGVYVTNETVTGFDVIELNNGTSNVSFNYQIVANRADEYNDKGELESLNADVRLAKAAVIEPSKSFKTPTSSTNNPFSNRKTKTVKKQEPVTSK